MVVGEDAVSPGVVIYAVRTLSDVDLLDGLERGEVKHRELVLTAIRRVAVLGLGDNCNTVDARSVKNRADSLSRLDVDHLNLSGMGNIEAMGGGIQREIVPTADWAGDRELLEDFHVSGGQQGRHQR